MQFGGVGVFDGKGGVLRGLKLVSAVGDRFDSSNFHIEVLKENLDWLYDVDERPANNQFALAMASANGDSSVIWTITVDSAHRRSRAQPDTTRTQRLLVAERGEIQDLAWSAGGRALNYILSKDGEFQLRRVNVDDNGSADGPAETRVSGLEWRASLQGTDSDDLYFVRGSSTSNIWIGSALAAKWDFRPLTTGTAARSFPSVSPDGRRVAFVMQGNVYSVDVESGIESNVTDVDSATGPTAWSPDGRALAFGLRQKGANRVAILREGRVVVAEQSRLFADGGLTWSADGRIVYERQNVCNLNTSLIPSCIAADELTLLNETTGQEILVLPADSVAAGMVRYPRVSPDGRQLAFFWWREGANSAQTGTYIKDLLSGRSWKLVSGLLAPLGWSANGRAVYLSDANTYRILEMPVNGGIPIERARLNGEITNGSVVSGTVVLQLPSGWGDVWRIEDLSRRRKR
jgi:Tol biopolymer transport system component